MKRIVFFIIIFSSILLAGCDTSPASESLGLPFENKDIVSIDAYYYLEGFTTSGRKKCITKPENIQAIYSAFQSLDTYSGDTNADEYTRRFAHEVSAYCFHLADGTVYEIIHENYEGKDGIVTGQDITPCFTSVDISNLWLSLTEDAVGCREEELPVPYRKNPVPEITAPKVYIGEEAEVYKLVMDFFVVKQLDFFSAEDHCLAEYFLPELRETLGQQLYSKVFRFEKLVRRDILDDLTEEKINAAITDITIADNTATVKAYESYSYYLRSSGGLESSRITSFVFTCEYYAGKWLISHIETNNEAVEGIVAGLNDIDAYFLK